ncbi:hypothetical protein BJ546DRAFT_353971 [Cryomyces antarcticus]
MSQHACQSTMASFISLPLSKYSSATGLSTEGKIPWTHLLRDDIYVLFDSFHVSNSVNASASGREMKIVQGTTVLEHISIEDMIREVNLAVREARHRGIELLKDQLPLVALFKRETLCIALRYRMPDGQTRRVQLKLRNDQDFQTAFDFLRSMDCPMSDSSAPQRALMVQGPSCPASSLDTLRSTPATAQPPQESGIRSSSINSVPPLSDFQNRSSQVYTLSPLSMQSHNVASHTYHAAYEPQPHQAPGFEPSHQPSQSQLYRSHTLPAHVTQQDQYQSSRAGTTLSAGSDRHGLADSTTGCSLIRQHSNQPPSRPDMSDVGSTMPPPPAGPSSLSHRPYSAGVRHTNESHLQSVSQQGLSGLERPYTAPAPHDRDNLSHLIPPRRELPFKRSSTSVKLPVQDESHCFMPPSSTGDRLAAPGDPVKMSDSSRPTLVAASERTERVRTADALQSLSSDTLVDSGTVSVAGDHSSPQRLPPPRSLSPAKDLPLFAKSATRQTRNKSSLDADFEYVDGFGAFVSKPPAHSASDNTESLAQYASQPDEARRTAIDDLICRNLNDDNFLMLCEDVESCWRRIGLGI